MEHSVIRIAIVDDHDMVRHTWKLLLEQQHCFAVVAEARTGEEAITLAAKLKPDVMLLDINLPYLNGIETTRHIMQHTPLPIIAISINNQPAYARAVLQAGGKGYVTKDSSPAEMREAIHAVLHGKEYICKKVQPRMQR